MTRNLCLCADRPLLHADASDLNAFSVHRLKGG